MKKLQTVTKDNSGASAIMFAMFFVIIISLITIGFATLVRRDQRATLDKTLSAQAQLLTESGVNSVKQYYANAADPKTNNDCIPTNADNPGYIAPIFGNGDRITCLTWTENPTESTFSLQPYESYSFNQKNHTGWTKLEWTTDGAANNAYYAQLGGNQLPSIVTGNKSIIKMVTVNRQDIYDVSPKKVQVVYLVPYGGADVSPGTVTPASLDYGNDYVDLGNAGVGTLTTETSNGLVYYIPCPGSKCSINIAGYAFANGLGVYGDRLFYFMPLGTNETSIQYQSLDTYNGTPQPLDGIQIKIDATAISQDQIKRLITYIPANPDTDVWKPFYGALADGLCKDIKIDGINSTTASGIGAVCP